MSKKLKTGLRFNLDMRIALASIIATSRLGATAADLHNLHAEVTGEITQAFWKKSAVLEQDRNVDTGDFPIVKVFNITLPAVEDKYGSIRHAIDLAGPTLIPFAVYIDMAAAFEAIDDDNLKDLTADFIRQNATHQLACQKMKTTLMGYLKPFTSPAKLLEKSPDFEQHFPDSYYEEVEAVEPEMSLDDLLAA